VTSLRFLVSLIAVSAMGLSCRPGLAQSPAPILPTDNSGATVRLELHEKQTQFKLGDPITLDLVVTARSPGYAVVMDGNRFNSPQDLVNVTPTDGWFRSEGDRDGGSLEDLAHDPVRIPVRLSRSIVFQQPGHYEITITTMRLLPSRTGIAPGTQCCAPRWSETTNAVGVDILRRDEHEESALVAQLSSFIEKEKPQNGFSDDFKKQQEALLNELEGMLKNPPADTQRMMELALQLRAAQAAELARIEKQKEARREAAIRLSYLQGDDAVRAKVRWILADNDHGGDDTGLVMLDGLAHSRNLQLQMKLLQAAWVDTQLVPTDVLQSALQQTKAFLQNKTFELYNSHGVPGRMLPHTEVVEEYNRELGEIVATLPQRTGPNREQTAYYLLMSGHGLNPRDASSVRAVIAEEFGEISPGLQGSLLGMRWKELCDPALPIAPEPLKSACAASKPPPEAEVPAR
jgi:hypothetical protein